MFSGTGIGRSAVLIQSTLIADADGTTVERPAVCPDGEQGTVLRDTSVFTDIEMVSDSTESARPVVPEHLLDGIIQVASELAARHIVTDAARPSASDDQLSSFENSEPDSDAGISVNFLECQIEDMGDEKNVRLVSSLALRELSDRLYELNRSLERSFFCEHFIRLADRILTERDYGGSDIRAKVRAEIAQWKNSTPDEEIESSREEKMRQSYENIVAMKFRRNFQAYVRNYTLDMEQKKSAIGKFLFHCRREITKEELRDFMTELFRIIYLRRDQQKEVAARSVETAFAEPSAEERSTGREPDVYLSDRLLSRPVARQKFYELLKKSESYICHILNLRQRKDPSVNKYEGWTWWHLKRAFLEQGFLMSGLTDKDFFTFLSQIFPNRTYSGISKGYYRCEQKSSDGITERVKAEFRVVEEMI